jgi:CheY-like chemotaxis protein
MITRFEMPNTRKILIVDDDPELREALIEQLSLHEEFEAVAAENGSKGVQAAKAGQIDPSLSVPPLCRLPASPVPPTYPGPFGPGGRGAAGARPWPSLITLQ